MRNTERIKAVTNQGARRSFGRIARVAAGNLLEMYDFMVFGYYAVSIAKAFFPAQSAFSGLMLTFMTFGAGFLNCGDRSNIFHAVRPPCQPRRSVLYSELGERCSCPRILK
jgi:hypothetical protein